MNSLNELKTSLTEALQTVGNEGASLCDDFKLLTVTDGEERVAAFNLVLARVESSEQFLSGARRALLALLRETPLAEWLAVSARCSLAVRCRNTLCARALALARRRCRRLALGFTT